MIRASHTQSNINSLSQPIAPIPAHFDESRLVMGLVSADEEIPMDPVTESESSTTTPHASSPEDAVDEDAAYHNLDAENDDEQGQDQTGGTAPQWQKREDL